MEKIIKTPTKREIHEIDAANKATGRLATAIAMILMGKNKAGYTPNKDEGDRVLVSNVDKMKFTGKKFEAKKYYHHSGYPGGLKAKSLREIFEKNPEEILKKAVWNMLPKNKLRSEMIKRLKFSK